MRTGTMDALPKDRRDMIRAPEDRFRIGPFGIRRHRRPELRDKDALPQLPLLERADKGDKEAHEKNCKNWEEVGLFDRDEISLGMLLGMGGFAEVYEVDEFQLDKSTSGKLTKCQQAVRDFLERHTLRDLIPFEEDASRRYAIKFLQKRWVRNIRDFEMAATDLANEASILRQLDHPNIIRLRGCAVGGTDAYHHHNRRDAYFLIVDRLQETLSTRIFYWRSKLQRLEKRKRWLGWTEKRKQAKRTDYMVRRLEVAFDLARAFEYLHDQGYIYRDIKSANVGFNVRGDVQIFDFGLARKVPQSGAMAGQPFEMSGDVGTRRYMAPEVALNKPYDFKADVYSFTILLHQILSLKSPFAEYNKKTHFELVTKGTNRLDIEETWPEAVKQLLCKGWSADPQQRPTMRAMRCKLQNVLAELGGDEAPLDLRQRRSTYVFEMPQELVKSLEEVDGADSADDKHANQDTHTLVTSNETQATPNDGSGCLSATTTSC